MLKNFKDAPMVAVLYHADTTMNWHGVGIYKDLVVGLKNNLHNFNIPLVHLTVTGHEGWGDETIFYDVESVYEVIYNREKCLLDFLKNTADTSTTYWFCEPDFRIFELFPPLTTDLCMTLRGDSVALTPAWRLAKKSAWPIFQEAFDNFDLTNKKWHGDSWSWIQVHRNMGSPMKPGFYNHNGISIELRNYGEYCGRKKYKYSGQWKGSAKEQIVSNEYKQYLEEARRNALKKGNS